MSYKYLDASALRGEKIKSIGIVPCDEIHIETESGKKYRMHHEKDCCESVVIHDVTGDLQDLVGFTLTAASEDSIRAGNGEWPEDVARPEYEDSWTWTTYTFETLASKVRIRWLGQSNGYYGEGVQIEEIE